MDNKIDISNVTIIDLKASRVDKENKIIKHVSILSSDAVNTNDEVVRQFSDVAMRDGLEIFNGAIARIDHDRENQSTIEPRGVGAGYGVYQDLSLEGSTLFGDLHLWDCPDGAKVLSIAERTPNAVGNSIHAGAIVHLNDNGIEIVDRLMSRTVDGFKPSVDLVEDPSATINLYQNRTVTKNESKESEMEFKDLTLDLIKTNRPDLEKHFMDAGKTSRDDEVKTLTEEKDAAVKKCDELEVLRAKAKNESIVDRLLSESELPDYAKTDAFRKQLVDVKETKEGDKTITIEDGVKNLIEDRIGVLEPGGVKGNKEKDLSQNKGNKTNADKDAEFVGAFGQGNDSDY